MATECNQESFGFHAFGRRLVVARFGGGRIGTFCKGGGGVSSATSSLQQSQLLYSDSTPSIGPS